MPDLYKFLGVLILVVGSIIINIASQLTLALDFPSRCQCKKLISVYLKLFSFQMVIQSMKYGTIHIHIIPREGL